MDSAIEPVRELPSKEFNRATDTRDMLARAARQREAYNLDDYRIIDIDAHHFETQSWDEIVACIPDPVIKDIANNFRVNGRLTPGIIQTSAWPSHQNVGGRIPHDPGTEESTDGEDKHRQVLLGQPFHLEERDPGRAGLTGGGHGAFQIRWIECRQIKASVQSAIRAGQSGEALPNSVPNPGDVL